MKAVRRSSLAASLTRRRSGSADRKAKDKDVGVKKPQSIQARGPAVTFDIIAESPPALLLGPPDQSSGALYAAKLVIKIFGDKPITLTFIQVSLSVTTTTLQPIVDKCLDCTANTTVLKEWNLLSQPKVFAVDEHTIPISYLIPGSAAVTTKGAIGSIEYQFRVSATSEANDKVNFSKQLFVNRALRRGNDKNPKRIFPPLPICMDVTTPSIVFPTGTFNIPIRWTGVNGDRRDDPTQHPSHMRWRLDKLDWRIVETEKYVSIPCPKHIYQASTGKLHEHSRVLAAAELKFGWKTDFAEDLIEYELVCTMEPTSRANTTMSTNPSTESPLTIRHALHVEMVFAESMVAGLGKDREIPTGNASSLRTQFPLVVTMRSGMGVAWDDEQPPLYEDVPGGPPVYPQAQIVNDAPALLTGSVERVQL